MGFHSLKSDKLPSLGKPGDVYYVTNGQQVFLAAADGVLVNLSDIVTRGAEIPRAVGPQGEQGLQGPPGRDGRDGRDGAQGPQGARGETGPRGETGAAGRDGRPGEKGDTGSAGRDGVQTVDLTPSHLALIEEIRFKLDALLEKDAKGQQYIQWLRERVGANRS
jgi:hypothetical protein